MAKRLLIIGATSVLAQETAKIFARENSSFALVARHKEKLDTVADNLERCGAAKVVKIVMDVEEVCRYESVLKEAIDALGGLDIAFLAHGCAHEQYACEHDLQLLSKEIQTNFTSTASLLMLIADFFEKQRGGVIAVISSVAGDRGRKAQYIYGSCKAALTVFLQGLRQRLHLSNVTVVTIKAGLADTPFTAHVKNRANKILFVKSEVIARDIYKAIKNRKDEIYVPWFWKYIMISVKMIPESIFKRMNF
jgi:short-subunit dehydrogenase